jgi:hypothetical protein
MEEKDKKGRDKKNKRKDCTSLDIKETRDLEIGV